MKEESVVIGICEPSYILRAGIQNTLKKISGIRFVIHELNGSDGMMNFIKLHNPDILILNPSQGCHMNFANLREDILYRGVKFIAMESSLTDKSTLDFYDTTISLYDNPETISEKLDKLLELDQDSGMIEETDVLSVREKEILTCVVRGMTNKEIALHLFLSTHTVISHRRNIARKLEIHSTAGLTIYAIVNKLISLDEVKL